MCNHILHWGIEPTKEEMLLLLALLMLDNSANYNQKTYEFAMSYNAQCCKCLKFQQHLKHAWINQEHN